MNLSNIPFSNKATDYVEKIKDTEFKSELGDVVKKTALATAKVAGDTMMGAVKGIGNAAKMGLAQEVPFLMPLLDKAGDGLSKIGGTVKQLFSKNDDKDNEQNSEKETIKVNTIEAKDKESVNVLETKDAIISDVLVDKLEVSSIESKADSILGDKLDTLIDKQDEQNKLIDKQIRTNEERQIDLQREKKTSLLSSLKDGVRGKFEAGKEKAGSLANLLKDKGKSVILSLIGGVLGGLYLFKDKILGFFKNLISNIGKVLFGAAKNMLGGLASFGKSLIPDFLKSKASDITGKVKTKVTELPKVAKAKTFETGSVLKSKASDLSDAVKAKGSFVVDKAKQTGHGVLDKTKSTVSKGAGVVKGAGKKASAKLGAKVAGKAVGKSLLKKIPIIGAAAGLGFAYDRFKGGDIVGAGLEALSGIASIIPGIGTAASVGIDGYLAKRDMDKANEENKTNTDGLYSDEGINKYLQVKNGSNIDRLNPVLKQRLYQMAKDYYEKTGKPLVVTGGYRSIEEQKKLYEQNPNREAKPGKSLYNFGLAVDIPQNQVSELQKNGLLEKYGLRKSVSNKGLVLSSGAMYGLDKPDENKPIFKDNNMDAFLKKMSSVDEKYQNQPNSNVSNAMANSVNLPNSNSVRNNTSEKYIKLKERSDLIKDKQLSITPNNDNSNNKTNNIINNQTVVNNYYINGQKSKKPQNFSF